MTLARYLPGRARSPRYAPAAAAGRFVPAVSYGPASTSGSAAGFSIAAIVWPLSGSPRCNSAPSDAPAGSALRIPSASTAALAPTAIELCSFVGSVDFFDALRDLGWGSWEALTPGLLKSRRGSSLLSEALLSQSLYRDQLRLVPDTPTLYQKTSTDLLMADLTGSSSLSKASARSTVTSPRASGPALPPSTDGGLAPRGAPDWHTF